MSGVITRLILTVNWLEMLAAMRRILSLGIKNVCPTDVNPSS